MSVPFHKQTDKRKLAGQIVNPIPEQYLHQYIARKTEEPPRITFKEWFNSNDGICTVQNVHNEQSSEEEVYEWLRDLWNSALTRGKISP